MESGLLEIHLKVPFLSAIGSSVLSFFVFPFDVLNTLSKIKTEHIEVKSLIKDVYKDYGLKGFYKGGSMIVYEIFPMYFVYYSSYNYLNGKLWQMLEDRKYKQKWAIPLVSSCLSELSCMAFYIPLDTVMTRMQSMSPQYNYTSLWDGLKSIYKNEGVIRFYYSSHIFVTYCLILTMVQFTTYEWMKALYQHRLKKKEFGTLESMIATVLSTSSAVLVTHPLNTLVVQHQMINLEKCGNETTIQLLKREFKEHKLKVFTRSVGLRMTNLNAFGLSSIPLFEFLRQKYGVDVEF